MHHRLYGINCKFNAKLGKKHHNRLSSDLGDGYLSVNNVDSPEAPTSSNVNIASGEQHGVSRSPIHCGISHIGNVIDLTDSLDSDDEPIADLWRRIKSNEGDKGKY